MGVIDITKDNFEQEVLKSDRPVLIDFMATWCGFCKMIAPAVEKIGTENTEIKTCRINVDEQPELADSYQIMTYPTLMVMKDGKEVRRAVAPKNRDQIMALFQDV